jgi:hypothetical protein
LALLAASVDANVHGHVPHHAHAARAYVASVAAAEAAPTAAPLAAYLNADALYDPLAVNAVEMFMSNTQQPFIANPKTYSNRKTRTVPSPTTATPTSSSKPSATAGRTITGTGTLPSATSFVSRNGTRLLLEGKTYRPFGSNIYWAGLDENVNPNVRALSSLTAAC